MNLARVMDELGDAITPIRGLRVYRWPAEAPVPPSAIVTFPDSYTFDRTYSRGSDGLIVPIVVLVGRATDRAARDLLAKYCAGSGPTSIKQAVEAHTYTSLDSPRVQSVTFDTFDMAGANVLAATFDVDIIGTGA